MNFIFCRPYFIVYTLALQKKTILLISIKLMCFSEGNISYKRFQNKIITIFCKGLISIYSTTVFVSEFIVTFLFPFRGHLCQKDWHVRQNSSVFRKILDSRAYEISGSWGLGDLYSRASLFSCSRCESLSTTFNLAKNTYIQWLELNIYSI